MKDLFISPDEKPLAILGKENMEGSLRLGINYACFCVATDKRLYIRGRGYLKGLGYKERREDQTIDIDSVTGSSFISVRFIYQALTTMATGAGYTILMFLHYYLLEYMSGYIYSYKIRIICSLVVFVACCIGIYTSGDLQKHKVLVLEYSGESIAFPASSYEMEEMAEFQADLDRALKARDAAKNAAAGRTEHDEK